MIINKKQFPVIGSDTDDLKITLSYGKSSMYSVQHFLGSKFKDKDYYYINIRESRFLHLLDIKKIIPLKYLCAIKNNSLGLCIDYSCEALPNIIDIIYQNIIHQYEVDPKNILLIFGSPDVKNYIKENCEKYKCEMINVEWFNFFEMSMKNQNLPYLNPLKNKNHKKSYINLNRVYRLHRTATLFMLQNRNLIDKGFNSFKLDPNIFMTSEITLAYFKNSIIADELNFGKSVLQKLPLTLDIDDFTFNPNSLDYKIASFFANSYISLVGETFFENNMPRFLSEKSFKPIFAKHPFILLSTPGSLDLIKSIGYKTFEGIIDESYDKEINEGNRLKLAIDQLERIVNYSNSDIENFKENCIPIVEENFKLLLNKEIFLYDADSLSLK